MRRFARCVCALLLAILAVGAVRLARDLPPDRQRYVQQKYVGWNGVLRAWVCADWKCDGSFIRWLNACAAAFEKQHEGVYVEYTPVSREAMRALRTSGIRPPELLLFSPGVLDNAADLALLDASGALRPELRNVGQGYALPVAMGGYIIVREAADAADEAPALPEDADGCCYAGALIGLLSGDPSTDETGDEIVPDSGVDLGLPAAARASAPAGAAIATQADIGRLARLRDAGRDADWVLDASGEYMWADQLLLAGAVYQMGDDAQERMALSRALIEHLLSGESQRALSGIGALSVTDDRIYSDFSAYAPLDALAHRCSLVAPDAFACAHGDCQAIVRKFLDGQIAAPEALAQLAAARRAASAGHD